VIHPNSIAVSREHRLAKTDRLDTALVKRAFLGWLRGERKHCSMAAIPSLEEEDARRPSRERENLVGERSWIGNRIKSTLARLGIRGFKPALRTAAQQLERSVDTKAIPRNSAPVARIERALMTIPGGGDPSQALLSRRLREWARRPGTSPRVKPVG